MIEYNVYNRTVCIEIAYLEVLFSHTFVQNLLLLSFLNLPNPLPSLYNCLISFILTVRRVHFTSFYKIHTVFACLHIFCLYINMYTFVKG